MREGALTRLIAAVPSRPDEEVRHDSQDRARLRRWSRRRRHAGLAIGRQATRAPDGSALERATEAALAHTGGGTVIETETGDDGAAYGVEIELDDGTEVEVELDENFDVIGRRQTTTGATRKSRTKIDRFFIAGE